jgi:hypothetical protein
MARNTSRNLFGGGGTAKPGKIYAAHATPRRESFRNAAKKEFQYYNLSLSKLLGALKTA